MIFNDPVFWTLALFLIPLVVRVPIAVALGTATIAVVWFWDMGYQMLSYSFYAGIAKTPLLAIPFFILAGIIMEKVGIAERIIALIKQIVGDMTGGLAIATVIVAAFWGAVSGYRENKINGLLSQGLGTSMLQVPNIVKNPLIWIPPIVASAVNGPISAAVFQMRNSKEGSGMGTSGLVGQFGAFSEMGYSAADYRF